MSRRSKIVIAVIILLLLLVLGLWFWLTQRGGTPFIPAPTNTVVNANQPQGGLLNNASVTTNVNGDTTPEPVAPAPQADSSASLKRLASAFAERYGSFSSLGDYENQTDLKPFMTASFSSRTDSSVAAQRAQPQATTYYGVTTRAINATIDSFDETSGDAVITVKTQRTETTEGAAGSTVKYQDIVIVFIKENGSWKADSARWQ